MKLMLGSIDSIVNGGAYVIVPEYDDHDAFGPCQMVYSGTAPEYEAGDRVLVGQVGRIKEDLIVIGKVG